MTTKMAKNNNPKNVLPIHYLSNNNLCLVGISHLMKGIDKEIEEIFEQFKPDMLLLELDYGRYYVIKEILDSGDLDNESLDLEGIQRKWFSFEENNSNNDIQPIENDKELKTDELIQTLEDFQWKLSKKKEILLGMEFFSAIKLAGEKQIPIKLIDISIDELMEQIEQIDNDALNKLLTQFKEADLQEIEEEYEDLMLNLNNEDFIHNLISQFKEEHPEFSEILITKRDKEMAKRIREIIRENPNKKILALLGVGHFEGILNELKDLK
ncbi:MAG: TraB/GumN family protein [Promethearchaeota archaeon]